MKKKILNKILDCQNQRSQNVKINSQTKAQIYKLNFKEKNQSLLTQFTKCEKGQNEKIDPIIDRSMRCPKFKRSIKKFLIKFLLLEIITRMTF